MITRALVIDDSSFMRAIIADTLQDLGVAEILQAEDGVAGLKVFRKNEVDLIVLDWQMPRMCGLEVADVIRKGGSKVPIVMVTAMGTKKEHVVDAFQVGVSDYLLKPFNPTTLREKLAKYCLGEVAATA